MENITDGTRDHLVDLYFRFIHDKPHTLFHPILLRKRISEGTIGLSVLYGIMALAARYIHVIDTLPRADSDHI